MKGKHILGFVLASLLVVSGCSSTSVKENGKDVVASIDDTSILADDLYTSLSSSSRGQAALFDCMLQKLVDEKCPITDDMRKQAEDYVKNTKASFQAQYGDEAEEQLESQLASYGYESLDDYEESLIKSLQSVEFIKKYVKENYDDVYDDYYKIANPRQLSLIKVSMADIENPTDEEKEKLEEVKKLLGSEKDFGDTAASYSDDTSKTAKGNIGIVDTKTGLSSTYGENVEKKALALKENEISKAIKGNDGYYFLKCTSTNKDTIKEELKAVDLESPLLTYDDYITYMAFLSYDLKYDDSDIEKAIKEYVDQALQSRKESRGDAS